MKESQFNILLKVHERQIKGIAGKYVRNTQFPFREMESHLIEEFWNCCNDFDPVKDIKLKTYTEKRLSNKALDVMKTRNFKDYENQLFLKEEDDGEGEKDAATFEVSFGHYTKKDELEELVERKVMQQEKDQLQLISYLTDPAKVTDPVTTAIVTEWFKLDKPTPTAIGKRLGLNHTTVIRKLRKLADNFDELQFGNYRRFLSA